VTVDTGATTITTTNTTTGGADDTNDTDTVVFGTPIAIGTRGVTITFTDDSPSTRGDATCVSTCDDDATSGGTYGGSTDGTYTVTVTTGGKENKAVIDCTGLDCGAAPGTNVCGGTGPQCAYATAFDVGGDGVTITFTDQGANFMTAGDSWTIAVTAGEGLAANEVWTITVDITTSPPAPDYVGFCLTCHDGSAPAGAEAANNLENVAAHYLGNDQHGAQECCSSNNGYLKSVWNPNAGAGNDHTTPYAALQCTTCHDQHGTNNIYHLKQSITVNGQQMTIYDGTTTDYTLPCLDTDERTVIPCTQANATQYYRHWAAYCSFCHVHTNHNYPPNNEDTTCSAAHVHGGSNF
jgi:predicted CXXCH cytochrome family protein